MLTSTITHSHGGYRLRVVETPLWAVVAETTAETACTRLGHAFCQGRGPIPFWLGQRLLSVAARREQERWSAPLTDDEVRRVFPESVLDLDED